MKDSKTLLELIRHSPKFTISFLAFITAIVSFIILYRENPQLIIVVLIAVLLIASWLIFFYIVIAKSPPLIMGGERGVAFPKASPCCHPSNNFIAIHYNYFWSSKKQSTICTRRNLWSRIHAYHICHTSKPNIRFRTSSGFCDTKQYTY